MNRFIYIIDRIIEVLAGSALIVSASMILINVFNRYVVLGWLRNSGESVEFAAWLYKIADGILSPISATGDEVPGLLLVWIAFLGAYLAYRKGGHISFDMFVDKFPHNLRLFVQTITKSAILIFLITLLYLSILMIVVDGETEIETAEIAQGWFMLIIPLSSALMAFAVIIDIVEGWIHRGQES